MAAQILQLLDRQHVVPGPVGAADGFFPVLCL